MAYSYEYNTGAGLSANPGNIKVKNIIWSFNKRTGTLRIEFDLRGLDWNTADSDYVQCKILYGVNRAIKNFYPQDSWRREFIEWQMGTYGIPEAGDNDMALIKHSISNAYLMIYDENDSTQIEIQSPTAIVCDLDPNEYHLTVLNPPSFGDDSTPDVIWRLTDLFSEQLMTPEVGVGGSTANSLTVTFTDGTTVSGLTSGFVNLNGVPFGSSSVVMNSANAGKAYWKEVDKYKITAPTMSEGANSFTIDLKCTKV
jgi:hypothetical protein